MTLRMVREGNSIVYFFLCNISDDDFDAFYSIAHSTSSVNVRITVVVDATSSSGARKKSKSKTSLAANPSLDHGVAENEQVIIEKDGTSPPTTDNETNPKKRKNSVVMYDGDSEMLEGTSKPRKKRKKDKSGSVAVTVTSPHPVQPVLNNVDPELEMIKSQAPLASQIDGKETSISRAAAASDQSSSKSRNARRKKKLRDSQAPLTAEQPDSAHPPPTTEGDRMSKMLNKDPPKIQGVLFAEQLAGAISETSEHNRKQFEKLSKTRTGRQREKRKDPSSVEHTVVVDGSDDFRGISLERHFSVSNESDGKRVLPNEKEPAQEDRVSSTRRKKANLKSRTSTANELEAANADVKAAFSRILAAKRASLSSSSADHYLVQHSEKIDLPHEGLTIRHSEVAISQPALKGKSNISHHSDVVSEPSSSRAVIAEEASKAHDASHLTTSRSSSGSPDDEYEDLNRLGPTMLPIVSAVASPSDVDLDALIRGPKIYVKAIADVPSTEGSENGQGSDLVEDDEEEQTSRRARRIVAADSSEEADTDGDDDDGHSLLSMNSQGSSSPHPDLDHISFQLVDRLEKSQEVDNSGDVAFHAALAADIAVFKLADHNDATVSMVDYVPETADNGAAVVRSSQGSTRPVNRLHNSPPTSPHPSPRVEGIIRRMKGRSGKHAERDFVFGIPIKFNGQPQEFDHDSSTARSVDKNNHKRSDQSIFQPVQEQAGKIITIEAEASSQKSMSLDTWTTLRASSPPDAESIMIDELRSSSPGSHSQVMTGKRNSNAPSKSKGDPLFVLTKSQPPFPYSQWNNAHASNDSEDEEEVQASIQAQSQPKTTQPKATQPPKYRRLTDIAGQRPIFSTPNPNLRPAHSSSYKLADMYGRSGVEEIESDTDTDSDSDAQVPVNSHIPKSRIAGVSRQTSSSTAVQSLDSLCV